MKGQYVSGVRSVCPPVVVWLRMSVRADAHATGVDTHVEEGSPVHSIYMFLHSSPSFLGHGWTDRAIVLCGMTHARRKATGASGTLCTPRCSTYLPRRYVSYWSPPGIDGCVDLEERRHAGERAGTICARVACLFSMMSYLSHFSLEGVFILLLVSALGTRKAGTDIGQNDVGGDRGSC